jgi:probable HAF family extracellular repeat protein
MQAFLLKNGALTDLKLAAPNSAAYLVEGNLVVGVLQTASGDTHAFVKNGDTVSDLGTFGGANSTPYAMNASGDVVGAAETTAGPRHAFLAKTGSALTDLGVPNGATSSEARGISDAEQIAMNLYDANHRSRPVVFVTGGAPIDLLPTDSTNPYFSAHVVAMSPAGNIVGWGVLASTADAGATVARCLLWTPKGTGS